jgi:hypothetical protein
MEFLAILLALLSYRIITDLWDCFGFTCADICAWLGRVAKKCADSQAARKK